VQIVDLGSGTGANPRAVGPILGCTQDWTLVEHDPALIRSGASRLAELPFPWRYRRLDLVTELERVAAEAPDLITASALLDLVSEGWLARLLELRRHTGAALYLALSYDGRIAWQPEDAADEEMHRLVDDHQRTDKGFGPALGPSAVERMAGLLDADDGRLVIQPSDWVFGADDGDLQRALLEGYVVAATAIAPEHHAAIASWAERRRALISARRSRLRVGHLDLLLLPP
jgi:hypothetical protein